MKKKCHGTVRNRTGGKEEEREGRGEMEGSRMRMEGY